jgi:UDP-GlcNAc:undecaprenyl-phosphate GlcNAc-1-phosphate transferase
VTAYLWVFLASAGTVALVTPGIRWFAVKVGAIDRPSDRKVHPRATPTLGGLGILLGIVVGLGVAYQIPEFRQVYRQSLELQGVLEAAAVITLIGLVDDVRTLSAPAKLAGQILAAGILVLNGVELLFFWFPGQGIVSLGADLAGPLTVAWILLMVNAVNLIDGLDGLAAGIVAIGSGAFFIWVVFTPSPFVASTKTAAVLAVVAGGSALGFLPWNFHQAKIFMGDSGSMPLGLILGASTIAGVGHTLEPSGGAIAAFSIPILIPLFVVAVPLIDVAMAVVRRLRQRRPVFAPDKEHLHNQLQEIGHTHRQAVLLMYFWAILLAGSGLAVSFINGRALVGGILGGAVVLILATYFPRRIQRGRQKRRDARRALAERAEVETAPGSAVP